MPPRRESWLTTCTDAFIVGTDVLLEKFEPSPSKLGIAIAVNAALAAELAMKRYLEFSTGKAVRGHELKKLWEKVPAEVQKRVADAVCPQVPMPRDRFDEYLGKCSTTFVDWRYLFDHGPLTTNFHFLRAMAFEFRALIP